MISQQNLDGSLGQIPELFPRDSAAALLALAGRPASAEAVTRGAIYLGDVPEANTHFRSRRALALALAGYDPSIALEIGNVSVTEGNSGSVAATFELTLDSASNLTASVAWATRDGTATAPADYLSASGTVVFNPGET
ncbi:MAG: hypothetical protein GY722_26535, partial [bacterium]|nr:hypothetical protein [bacterium]